MNEHELGRALQVAIAEEPPLALDPDRLMERADRQIRRRRAMWATGGAVAAVAVAAVAVVPRQGGEIAPAATKPAPSPTSPAQKYPSNTMVISDSAGIRPVNAREVALGEYLTTRIPQVLPGVKVEGTEETDAPPDTQILHVRSDIGHASKVEVVVMSPRFGETSADFCKRYVCGQVNVEPGGTQSISGKRADGLPVAFSRHSDGTIVEVFVIGSDAKFWTGMPAGALTQLATDPKLTF